MMSENARLSKMLYESREAIEMFSDMVEIRLGERDKYLDGIVRNIDEFREEKGWNPSGFGGEQ